MESDEGRTGMVGKNFTITHEQSEWLREEAFREKVSQAAIIRRALDKARGVKS